MSIKNILDILSDEELAIDFYQQIPSDATAFYCNRGHWIAYKKGKNGKVKRWLRYLGQWVDTNITDFDKHIAGCGVSYSIGLNAIVKKYPLQILGIHGIQQVLDNMPHGADYYNHVDRVYYKDCGGVLHEYRGSDETGDCWKFSLYSVSHTEHLFHSIDELRQLAATD